MSFDPWTMECWDDDPSVRLHRFRRQDEPFPYEPSATLEEPASLDREDRLGMRGPLVYVLSTDGAERVKIGFTRSTVASRAAQLRTGCPFHIEVRHAIGAGQEVESYLHHRYAAVRQAGEWFRSCHAMLLELDALERAFVMKGHGPLTMDEVRGEIHATRRLRDPEYRLGRPEWVA